MSATTLDRGQIRQQLQIFSTHWSERIAQWRSDKVTGTESSFAQSFWSDLLACFGINAARIDLFEREATRASTGNKGSIDVFQSGVFIGEAKSLGVDLDKAQAQAQDYLAGGSIGQHEFPKYVVVTDFERIRIDQLGEGESHVEFTIDQVPAHLDEMLFLAGHETVTRREEQDASIHAAQLMAQLYEAMVGDEADQDIDVDLVLTGDPADEDASVQRASMMLTRILFLLYGDDAGLWEADLFHRWVEQRTDADNLGAQLHSLFGVLNTPTSKRNKNLGDLLARFPYVNGALFADALPLEYFTPAMRDALLKACRFRWTRISPAVFGAMFQLVKSKEARREAGEHYTSETNILKTIGPLFLDDLQAEANRLCDNKSTSVKALREFRDSLATHVFVDPACGCGNFLVVAYRDLRRIETQIIREIRTREGQTGMALDATLETKVTIGQFHGIEINWWPAKIAETAMFLVDHQANRELAAAVGQAPERLPIAITAHIHHTNALQIDWKDLLPVPAGNTYVFGNPPFRGDGREQDQLRDLQAAWGEDKQLSRMDFVTGWHAKTLQLYASRAHGEWAFVTTNSISQGDQVPRLFEPIFDAGWRIKFAHRTFAWDSEAPGKAAVHCVIVGFTRDRSAKPELWDYPDVRGRPTPRSVSTGINAYLVDGPNVLVTKAAAPISPEVGRTVYGSKPTDDGNLIVEVDEYDEVMADPIAAKYVHQFVGARELLRGEDRWCLWLDGMNPADASRSQILKTRIERVRDFRSASRAASTRDFAQFPHLFRQRAKQDLPYVCIPRHVSENRRYFPVAKFGPEVIAGDANFTLKDPDNLQFALISSSMFITWQRTIGGRIKSDLRFGSTLTWYTFPVPELTDRDRKRIIEGGQKVLDARAQHPDRSLADAYNPLAMDPVLVKAHDALDREVDRVFGASRKLSNERQRLELLFARYAELTH
ncbi:class I SAM-dependent DNA methyltransferase [Dietzia sp. SL131]|uniref:DNA methyltransferase n=1 Tax=unclassified Dietzia TaxID=2617939 RepID=UPI000BDE6696|nr:MULTISPECIES: DNA methyltransferase [unclassified Dietzia]MCY1656528.1 class I SAM-dependent DNA methyltransferase [Dietzia sp. SL131]